jgi:hypothetical protein
MPFLAAEGSGALSHHATGQAPIVLFGIIFPFCGGRPPRNGLKTGFAVAVGLGGNRPFALPSAP